MHRIGGCDAEREVVLPQENIELELAHPLPKHNDFIPCEQKEDNNETGKKMSSVENKVSEGVDTSDNGRQHDCKEDNLAFTKIEKKNSERRFSLEENGQMNTQPGIKRAWRPPSSKEVLNDIKLSSYNADQSIESKLNILRNINNISINEIIEGEENYDEGVLEKSKSSYIESGENRVKLAGSRIAFINSGYQV